MKCWRKKGCPFNSNNSLNYMKCLQQNYSVKKCEEDNNKAQMDYDNIHDRYILFEKLQEYIKTPENKKIFDMAVEDYINKNFAHVKDINFGDKQFI